MIDDVTKGAAVGGEGSPVVQLAFGSFHFAPKDNLHPPKSVEAYFGAVQQALEQISSVEEITMPKLSPKYRERTLEAPPKDPDFVKRGEFFPRIAQGHDIRFTLRIPKRTQSDVFQALSIAGLGERFSITMNHDWGHPLAMVVPIEAQSELVSSGVAVVREFLRREFDRLKDVSICFECMGPSPAHAEFTLKPKSSADFQVSDLFQVLEHERRGYDLFSVGYDAEQLPDPDQISQAWFRRISRELAFYYQIITAQHRQLFDWIELTGAIDKIVETQRNGGVQAFLARTFRRKPTNDALIDLALFEMEELRARQSLKQRADKIYGPTERGLLEPLVVPRIDELQPRPVDQLGSLLQRFEGRRVTDRDLVFIVFSSVVGAAIGAAATLISAG